MYYIITHHFFPSYLLDTRLPLSDLDKERSIVRWIVRSIASMQESKSEWESKSECESKSEQERDSNREYKREQESEIKGWWLWDITQGWERAWGEETVWDASCHSKRSTQVRLPSWLRNNIWGVCVACERNWAVRYFFVCTFLRISWYTVGSWTCRVLQKWLRPIFPPYQSTPLHSIRSFPRPQSTMLLVHPKGTIILCRAYVQCILLICSISFSWQPLPLPYFSQLFVKDSCSTSYPWGDFLYLHRYNSRYCICGDTIACSTQFHVDPVQITTKPLRHVSHFTPRW